MNERLDRITADLTEIKVTLAKQEANLAEHMRRTDLAETRVDHAQEQVAELRTFVHEVRTHIKGVKWAGGALVAAVGLAKTLGWL